MSEFIKKTPLFSVLIASYNNGKYLGECIESIFTQTWKNWEIIIVDDASIDSSNSVLVKYQDYEKVRIFRNKKNQGVGYTKRKCVEYARGEICGFVDADDMLSPNALELMVNTHADYPTHSIIYSTHYICDETLAIKNIADYVGQIPEQVGSWSLQRPVISQYATFKRSHYLRTEGIASIYKKAADKDLYYKLEETGPVLFIDKPLYYYRHHPDSISLNANESMAYQYELVAKTMVIMRHHKSKEIFKAMTHSRAELTRGILKAAFHEAGRLNLCNAASLFFLFAGFSPSSIVKIASDSIIYRWNKLRR